MFGRKKTKVTTQEGNTATTTKVVSKPGKQKMKSQSQTMSSDGTMSTYNFRKEKMKGGKVTTMEKTVTSKVNPVTGKRTKLSKDVVKGSTVPGIGTTLKTKYVGKPGPGRVKIVRKKTV